MNRIKEAFRSDTKYKSLLISILITGLSYGLYKGMLDNFLVEVVRMGEMDRGFVEFFRELPGVLLVFILAVFFMMSAETMYKAGAVIMMVGMAMHAVLPPSKVLITLAIQGGWLSRGQGFGCSPNSRQNCRSAATSQPLF